MDISSLQTTIKGLIDKAQDPANKDAFSATAGALKDLYEMFHDLSQGKTSSAQLQLTTLQDVNETLLAESDLDAAASDKGINWTSIAQDAVVLAEAGVKIAVIVAPLL